MDKQLIFGLGTGRCGTVSLTKLLNAQPGTEITHEAYTLPWEPDETKFYNSIHTILTLNAGRVGDVAYYWLPYVSRILADHHDAKFICLYRDKKLVVKSFVNHTPGRNYWTEPDGDYWLDEWEHRDTDLSFPRYNADKPDAISEYWEEYWTRANTWAGLCPNNFRLWNIEALNSESGQTEIFDFIGIPRRERIYDVGIRINATEDPLIAKYPMAIPDTISCNFCDDSKAMWRIRNLKNGTFTYVCQECEESGERLGSFKESIIV